MFVRAKRGRAITRVFFRYLHLTVMFSGLLQKDVLKERLSLVESFLEHNYCHACHAMFAVLFPLPSYCVSSVFLLIEGR